MPGRPPVSPGDNVEAHNVTLPSRLWRRIEVAGAMGTTVIEVQPGRARVASDPGPRQYCVRQGWLTQPNAIAICAPSHISLSIAGRASSHDSLAY